MNHVATREIRDLTLEEIEDVDGGMTNGQILMAAGAFVCGASGWTGVGAIVGGVMFGVGLGMATDGA
jgi:hypothetical protein